MLLLAVVGLKGKYENDVKPYMSVRPAENFRVVTLQTPLRFLGQNLFRDHFSSRSEARKVCPRLF